MPHKDLNPRGLDADEQRALAELEAAEAADVVLRERNLVPPTSKGMLERMDIGECPGSIRSEPSRKRGDQP